MKHDRFIYELLKYLGDTHDWRLYEDPLRSGGSITFNNPWVATVIGRQVFKSSPPSLGGLIRFSFQRDSSGVSITGVLINSDMSQNDQGHALARVFRRFEPLDRGPAPTHNGWNENVVLSVILACIVDGIITNEGRAWLRKQLPSSGSTKKLQLKVLKSLGRINPHADPPEYPPIVKQCLDLLHKKFDGFKNIDLEAHMDRLKECFGHLNHFGVTEEEVVMVWRNALIEGVLES